MLGKFPDCILTLMVLTKNYSMGYALNTDVSPMHSPDNASTISIIILFIYLLRYLALGPLGDYYTVNLFLYNSINSLSFSLFLKTVNVIWKSLTSSLSNCEGSSLLGNQRKHSFGLVETYD